MSVEQMAVFDKRCSYDQAKAKMCINTHTKRNIDWSENITSILKESATHRVVAFMHRFHAVSSAQFQPGVDSLMQKQNIRKIRFIDFTGGFFCRNENNCMDFSDETEALKNKYFYRVHRKINIEPTVKSFQVHLPTKRVNADGSLQ
ncbi:hypothetical protein [Corallincola spongiicola]|uniref:hypothetical protein n=1 Tax=Corallincola spongiicola TaxID=2520508 RepID=UPI001FE3401D|nr:hypothetical protein [Corallincola spongiicola]